MFYRIIPYFISILQRKTHVSCQGYDGILLSVQLQAVNQGGTADSQYSSLAEDKLLSGAFFII